MICQECHIGGMSGIERGTLVKKNGETVDGYFTHCEECGSAIEIGLYDIVISDDGEPKTLEQVIKDGEV